MDGLKKKLKESFASVSINSLWGTAKDTLEDAKKNPKEHFALAVAAIVVPGGILMYSASRIKKYRDKATNDNGLPEPKPPL